MNKSILIGRLTRDPEVRGEGDHKSARFTLAVDRRNKEKEADFVSCIAWDKTAELMAKYLAKGSKIGVVGRIQTGSYDGQNGKVYTTDIVVDDLEFLESKKTEEKPQDQGDGFALIPDDVADYDLPF